MPIKNDCYENCIHKCEKCTPYHCKNCMFSEDITKENKEKDMNLKIYYASGKALVDGKWQSCGWSIRAHSFTEAAKIAEADETFRIHSLSVK